MGPSPVPSEPRPVATEAAQLIAPDSPQTKPQVKGHGWFYAKKMALMCLSLVAGVACAVGHHAFYLSLRGTTPSDTSYSIWGFPHGVSRQQLNIAVGNTLAFLTKAFLAIAVAFAHDQINWKAIKNRPTKLGLIDALFSSRDDFLKALNVQMWWHLPLPSLLLLVFWLLPLVPLITPSTLTVRTVLVNTTTSMHTPYADFTSMNFAQLFWDSSGSGNIDTYQAAYQGPQFPVQKTVQGSIVTGSILPISAPGPNSTWTLDFYGPALNCSVLETQEGIGNDTIAQLASQLGQVSYASWVPPFNNETYVPDNITTTLRSVTVGGSPLSVYMMIPPSIAYTTIQSRPSDKAALKAWEQDEISYYKNNTYLQQCKVQNVSYTVDFTYTNGLQNITISTSNLLNDISYLSGFDKLVDPALYPYKSNLTTMILDPTDVQLFAYQSVMDTFSSLLVGSITTASREYANDTSIQYTVDTSMGTTALVYGKEMSNVTQALDLQYELPDSVQWDGKTINQYQPGTQPLTDLVEEMFRNATVSLMSNSALNPDYSSPHAPSNATVTVWTAETFYQYNSATLWVIYGIAIAISALSVLIGSIVIIGQRATYSSDFSTLIRIAQTLYLSVRIAPEDTSGKDPLPPYMSDARVQFPPEKTAAVETGGKEWKDATPYLRDSPGYNTPRE